LHGAVLIQWCLREGAGRGERDERPNDGGTKDEKHANGGAHRWRLSRPRVSSNAAVRGGAAHGDVPRFDLARQRDRATDGLNRSETLIRSDQTVLFGVDESLPRPRETDHA
jgi:hypothetical protein